LNDSFGSSSGGKEHEKDSNEDEGGDSVANHEPANVTYTHCPKEDHQLQIHIDDICPSVDFEDTIVQGKKACIIAGLFTLHNCVLKIDGWANVINMYLKLVVFFWTMSVSHISGFMIGDRVSTFIFIGVFLMLFSTTTTSEGVVQA
jgi:hypothetical protein